MEIFVKIVGFYIVKLIFDSEQEDIRYRGLEYERGLQGGDEIQRLMCGMHMKKSSPAFCRVLSGRRYMIKGGLLC